MDKIKNIILKQGDQIISDEGIKSFTVENLASELTMSKKTIYQYFPTKEFLIKKIIIFMLKQRSKDFNKVMKSESDPIKQFIKIMDLQIKFAGKINFKRLIYIKKRYPDIWDIIEKYRLERIETYTKLFLLAKEKGYLRDSLDPVISAKLFVNILNASYQPEFIQKNNISVNDAIYHMEKIITHGFFNKNALKKLQEYKNKKMNF